MKAKREAHTYGHKKYMYCYFSGRKSVEIFCLGPGECIAQWQVCVSLHDMVQSGTLALGNSHYYNNTTNNTLQGRHQRMDRSQAGLSRNNRLVFPLSDDWLDQAGCGYDLWDGGNVKAGLAWPG